MNLRDKVFGGNVDEKVIDYIEKIQRGNLEIGPNDEVKDDGESYLGDRLPYVRMWTAVNINQVKRSEETNKYESVGDNKQKIFVINENRVDGYNNTDEGLLEPVSSDITSVNELANNQYSKPPAGITSVNSKSEGAVGALRRTTVNFLVHNKLDFEQIFLPFFLKPGATVFVDFGWSDKNLSLYNPETKLNELNDLEMSRFYENLTQESQKLGYGFKSTISGQVTKYDVTVDQNGSFSCTLEFVSTNYSLLDTEVSDDNDLKYIFDNTIEELLLGYFVKLSGEDPDAIFNSKGANRLSNEERSTLIKEFFDSGIEPASLGEINNIAKKTGIFYQNILTGNDDEDVLDDKEALYISYGFFEDKFLNNFISLWETIDVDGNVQSSRKSEKPFSPTFSSVNSYVRFDNNLYTRQSYRYQDKDEKASYLYPNNWDVDTTYNKIKPNGFTDTRDDKEKGIMPIRELFISVPLISEAFRVSSNVNDALEFIFDKIKQDSGDIINIKLIQNNESQNSLTPYDVNITPQQDRVLEFDLTSGNTIVQSFDLKFETPKAGLSSMIAIGNLNQPAVFDELQLMKFNLLNAIQSKGKKYQIRHLPIYGDLPAQKKALTVQLDKLLLNSDSGINVDDFFPSGNVSNRYSEFKKSRDAKIKALPKVENEPEFEDVEKNLPGEDEDGKTIFYVSSDREHALTEAKIQNFILTSDVGISPVLPINLSLKVYGNNFLGIGDYFTVNYLPEQFKNRVFFQIVGVDHTLDTTGWSTSYTTVMRLQSTQKFKQFGDVKGDDARYVVEFHPIFKKNTIENGKKFQNKSQRNEGESIFVTKMKTKIPPQKIEPQFNRGPMSIDDIPPLVYKVNEKIFDRSDEQALDKYKKFNEKNKDISGRSKIKDDRMTLSFALSNDLSYGRLAAWVAFSNMLLSDDLINWDTSYKIKPFYSNLDFKNANFNTVYTIPRLQNNEPSDLYILNVLNSFDNVVTNFREVSPTAIDDFQLKIDNLVKTNLEGKQKISTKLNLVDMLTYGGFNFFNSIVWECPKDQATTFDSIELSGHDDFNNIRTMDIPTNLVGKKNGFSYDKVFKKLYRDYVGIKAVFRTLFENT